MEQVTLYLLPMLFYLLLQLRKSYSTIEMLMFENIFPFSGRPRVHVPMIKSKSGTTAVVVNHTQILVADIRIGTAMPRDMKNSGVFSKSSFLLLGLFIHIAAPVSYTHLTLPTNREV